MEGWTSGTVTTARACVGAEGRCAAFASRSGAMHFPGDRTWTSVYLCPEHYEAALAAGLLVDRLTVRPLRPDGKVAPPPKPTPRPAPVRRARPTRDPLADELVALRSYRPPRKPCRSRPEPVPSSNQPDPEIPMPPAKNRPPPQFASWRDAVRSELRKRPWLLLHEIREALPRMDEDLPSKMVSEGGLVTMGQHGSQRYALPGTPAPGTDEAVEPVVVSQAVVGELLTSTWQTYREITLLLVDREHPEFSRTAGRVSACLTDMVTAGKAVRSGKSPRTLYALPGTPPPTEAPAPADPPPVVVPPVKVEHLTAFPLKSTRAPAPAADSEPAGVRVADAGSEGEDVAPVSPAAPAVEATAVVTAADAARVLLAEVDAELADLQAQFDTISTRMGALAFHRDFLAARVEVARG